jgi:hypothetical protein
MRRLKKQKENTDMENISFGNFAAVKDDGEDVLGKILYYTLSSVMIDRGKLAEICEGIGFPHTEKRPGLSDAFRNATGDISDSKTVGGGSDAVTFKIYCRDNKAEKGIVSRELVKETLRPDTNDYKKLANIMFSKDTGFSYGDLAYDEHVDPLSLCLEAERLFELYQSCAGRKQIETLLDAFVASLSAVKILAHGKLYFVPRSRMAALDVFEDLMHILEENNLHRSEKRMPLDANSMFVVDDEKQRGKMASAFYRAARREIEEYAERARYFIESGCQSAAVMDRWILKISALEAKKGEYESILNRELDELNGELNSLAYLSDELKIRARGLKNQKAA